MEKDKSNWTRCWVEEMMKCPICRVENTETAAFCKACGNRILGRAPPRPTSQLLAVAVGSFAGSVAGLLMGFTAPYWPGPPYAPAFILIYGLGAFAILLGLYGERLFPEKVKAHLVPFSVAFAGTYYFFCFGYLFVTVA